MSFDAPTMDYAGLSPIIALTTGLVVLVLAAVFDRIKRFGPALALLAYAVTAGCLIWQWDADVDLVSGALRLDGLAVVLSLLAVVSAAVAVLLAIGDPSETQTGRSDWVGTARISACAAASAVSSATGSTASGRIAPGRRGTSRRARIAATASPSRAQRITCRPARAAAKASAAPKAPPPTTPIVANRSAAITRRP